MLKRWELHVHVPSLKRISSMQYYFHVHYANASAHLVHDKNINRNTKVNAGADPGNF